ncbi:MAG: TIGR02281 family clan AA aspartic protease [Pseudomonadota bacterium]
MSDRMQDDRASASKIDLIVLIAGCVGVFLGVFYFERLSTAATASIDTARSFLASSLPDPSHLQASGAEKNAAPQTAIAAPSVTSATTGANDTQSAATTTERRVFLKADRYNQFYADAYINGRKILVLVDTGASHVSLAYEDARALGLFLFERDFTAAARTANGLTKVAPVRIDRIRIGEVEVRDVDAFVGAEGVAFPTLLGMTFLRKLDRMSVRGRQLELVQ